MLSPYQRRFGCRETSIPSLERAQGLREQKTGFSARFGANRLIWAVAALFFVAVAAAAAEVDWQAADFPSASAKARREGKLIYIYVEGSNCPPCEAFKASHLHDPVFIDFINSLFVPIRLHEGREGDRAFLQSLRLVHGAVPRFYVLTDEGRGVSMMIGAAAVAPSGAVDVLRMAAGHEIPVDRNAAEQLAGRIRKYAAGLRADGGERGAAVAAVEAWSWAIAGRLDEAQRAWGREWADRMRDQDLLEVYVLFWKKWNRNAEGVRIAEERLNESGALSFGTVSR